MTASGAGTSAASGDGAPLHGSPIELRGIGKRYDGLIAVDNLTLNIAAGEFVSFLGPSGSGKTTTLLLIAGFITPNQGVITRPRRRRRAFPGAARRNTSQERNASCLACDSRTARLARAYGACREVG